MTTLCTVRERKFCDDIIHDNWSFYTEILKQKIVIRLSNCRERRTVIYCGQNYDSGAIIRNVREEEIDTEFIILCILKMEIDTKLGKMVPNL